jgi:hypothetical protein
LESLGMGRGRQVTRTESMALVVVGCILILALGAGSIMLKLLEARTEARETMAVFDGIEGNPSADSVLITSGNVFKSFFREPFESVVFIFRDGTFLTYSTQHDKAIEVPISWIAENIVQNGHSIPAILLCVHNHFTPVGFTPGDKDSYRYLRGRGFRGIFAIYYTVSGKLRTMEER